MDIITRADAKAAGQTTYFTGKPCSKGHIAPRSVANWNCLTCAAAISKKRYDKISKTDAFKKANRARIRTWQRANLERYKAAQADWRAANKETKAAMDKAYREANKESLSEKQAARRAGNPKYLEIYKRYRERPGDKERIAKNGREWRARNPDRVKNNAKNWRDRNPERVRHNVKEWRRRNPEKAKAMVAASAHKRRQRIAATDAPATAAQIMAIYARGMCAICARTDGPMELDHIRALASGGTHHVSNLQLLCRPCNRWKWRKDQAQWLAERSNGI